MEVLIMPIETQGVLPSLWREVIPFFHGDANIELTQDRGIAVREYLVPWERRQEFAQQILGYPYMVTMSGSDPDGAVQMRRHLPESIEVLLDEGDMGYMTANHLKFSPLGGGGEVIPGDNSNLFSPRGQLYRSWEWAKFTVQFQTEEYDVLDIEAIKDLYGPTGDPAAGLSVIESKRYVAWNDDGKTEMGLTDGAMWLFKDDTKPQEKWKQVGNKIGVPIPSGEVTLTWYDVHPDGYSITNFLALQGATNAETWFGYPPETLVFDSWKRRRRRSPFGGRTLNIEFRFVLRPKGTNKAIAANGELRDVVSAANVANQPFVPRHFYGLFHANTIPGL